MNIYMLFVVNKCKKFMEASLRGFGITPRTKVFTIIVSDNIIHLFIKI